MVYANQQEYYYAIALSTAEGQSGPFIDFMLNEILKTLETGTRIKVPQKVTQKVTQKVPKKSDITLLHLLQDNPRLTRVELAEKIGISESGVKKIIAKMKEDGRLERKGDNRNGYWVVKNENK